MELTGKFNNDFIEWLIKKELNPIGIIQSYKDHFHILSYYIQQWLDSVGIVLLLDYDSADGGVYCVYTNNEDYDEIYSISDTRIGAVKKAIKQTNKIYNETH